MSFKLVFAMLPTKFISQILLISAIWIQACNSQVDPINVPGTSQNNPVADITAGISNLDPHGQYNTNRCKIDLHDILKNKMALLGESEFGVLSYRYAAEVIRKSCSAAQTNSKKRKKAKKNQASITIQRCKDISFFCPLGTDKDNSERTGPSMIHLKNNKKLFQDIYTLTCEGQDKFNIAGETVDIKQLKCLKAPLAPSDVPQKVTENYGAVLRASEGFFDCPVGWHYEIGYSIKSKSDNLETFLKTIDLCFDKNKATTLWSRAKLQRTNLPDLRASRDSDKWLKGILFDHLNMDNMYKRENSYDELKDQIGLSDVTANKYIKRTGKNHQQMYLAKGHLIANGDTIYDPQKLCTTFYANAVPQWHKNNNGNWKRMEEYLQFLVDYHEHSLDIWAGGIGILNIEGKDIYLNAKLKMVPVPKFLFKIALNAANFGIVFIVVNDPEADKDELNKEDGEYRICKKLDECDTIFKDWNDPQKGYIYCCSVGDFYQNYSQDIQKLGYFKDKTFEILKLVKRDEERVNYDDCARRAEDFSRTIENFFDRLLDRSIVDNLDNTAQRNLEIIDEPYLLDENNEIEPFERIDEEEFLRFVDLDEEHYIY